jgi:hypothetical protein
MSHCRSDRAIATLPTIPTNHERSTVMFRSPSSLALALFAAALVAVPAAFSKGGDDHAVRVSGICSRQSTSTLKLGPEDRGVEVEFEVDQNRSGVPWKVALSRNGKVITSLTATTRAPSGSFEIRRVIAGRLGTARITALATRTSGERCAADSAARSSAGATAGHDAGDDHGRRSGGHS